MRHLKPLALIGILLLALSSVLCVDTPVMPVSATTVYSRDYCWMGGYFNITLAAVNCTDGSVFLYTTTNQSLDYWEDLENFTFTDGSPYNVSFPKADFLPSYYPQYSIDLSATFGIDVWDTTRLQWRTGEGDGYGKYGGIDTDYHTFVNSTGKYAVTPSGVVEVDNTGNWIGDGTNDGDGGMWARQMLFINVTAYFGACPPMHLLATPLVHANMDNWITTGTAYCNVTYPGHPLDGIEAGGNGIPWDSDFRSAVLIGAGAEVNEQIVFVHPLSGNPTPMNVSYIYTHKHLAARTDLLLYGDANMDCNVNGWDVNRMSDWWLADVISKQFGIMIGTLKAAGEWDEVYRVTKEVNSLDFNGDELPNLFDLVIIANNWLESGWSPECALSGFVSGTGETTKVWLMDAADPTATPRLYCDGQEYVELNDAYGYDVGNTFTVWANVSAVTELSLYQVGVTYDPAILTCTGYGAGEFFYRADAQYRTLPANQPMLTDDIGFLGYWNHVSWALEKPGNVSGTGTLAWFDFTVVGEGVTRIDIIIPDAQQAVLASVGPPYDIPPGIPFNTIDIVSARFPDINGDWMVNVWDLWYLSDAWLTTNGEPDYNICADFNEDDQINVWDLGIMSDHWLQMA